MQQIPINGSKGVFDEIPIGKSNKMNIDEYPPDFNPAQLQAKKYPLPLGKRLQSKIWKVKKQALQQLLKIIQNENSKQYEQHQSIIIKSISDSNIQCQYLSIKILFNYLQKQNQYEGDAKIILKGIIQKIMTLEKQQIKNQGMEIIYWLFDHSYHQLIISQLNQYILNKNPKIIAATLNIIRLLLNNYGYKKLGCLQQFNKNLKLFAQVVRPVAKPQAIQLFKQIYKWIGQSSLTGNFIIHPQVKQQVTKWSKTYEIQPMQIKRGLKKGQQGKKINPMQQQQQDSIPIDVLPHYDSRWVDMILGLQKWKQKKQHLDEFIKKTKVNNIIPRQTSHFITLLKRLFSDNNINLLQCGFKIVKNLSKGLKRHFAITCKSILSYIYLKLKDNKAMIVDQTLSTLKSMAFSISLQDMQQQIRAGLKDKAPLMRQNSLKLLKQFMNKNESHQQQKIKKILKSLLQLVIQLTNDGIQQVRDISLTVLCKMKQMYGMLFFQQKLKGMNQKKINQIKATSHSTQNNNQNQYIQKMQIQQQYSGRANNIINMNHNKNNNKQKKQQSKQVNKQINTNTNSNLNIINNNNKSNIVMNNSLNNVNNMNSFNNSINSNAGLIRKMPLINNNQVNSSIQGYSNINQAQQFNSKGNVVFSTNNNSINQMNSTNQINNNNNYNNNNSNNNNNNNNNNNVHSINQLQEVKNEQWPLNPDSGHVLRLIRLFSGLGGIYLQLATPFKLKSYHIQLLQTKLIDQIISKGNASLFFKWVLWRLMIQDLPMCQSLMTITNFMIKSINHNMNDEQMILIMSLIYNSLEHNRINLKYLAATNGHILQISSIFRDKMLNFWISQLKKQQQNLNFILANKIIQLIKYTFNNITFNADQLVSLARLQIIFKNKNFMKYLQQKHYTKQYLKACGFKFQQQMQQQHKLLLKSGGAQFYINIKPQQKSMIYEIFKKNSHQCQQDIVKLQQQNSYGYQLINLHIKIMDTIMLPFLSYSIQSINIYNYFKQLCTRVTTLCEPENGYGQKITPHLRTFIRLLMFFMIDLSQSKMDNKDELMKTINKVLIVMLDCMMAEHLIQVLVILLQYALTNSLSKRLCQLLMRCINKTVKSPTCQLKQQKIVNFALTFFIKLLDQNKLINPQQPIYKSIKVLIVDLITFHKQITISIFKQRLYCENNKLKNEQLIKIIKQLISSSQKEQNNHINNSNLSNININNTSNIISNVVNSSSLPIIRQNNQFNTNNRIVQLTNLPKIDLYSNNNNKLALNQNIPLNIMSSNNTTMAFGQRKRLQNLQQLNQSFQQLIEMRDQKQLEKRNNINNINKDNINNNINKDNVTNVN